MHLILTKLKNIDMHEYSLDQVNIPRMYFQEQSADFNNKRNYLSQEYKRISTVAATQNTEAVNAGPAPKRNTDAVTTHEPAKRTKTS